MISAKRRLDLLADDFGALIELDRAVVHIRQGDLLTLGSLFFNRELGRLARLGLDGETVEIAGLFGRLLRRDQLPGRVDRILDQHGLCLLARVSHCVLLRSRVLAIGEHRALDQMDVEQFLGLIFGFRGDFGVEIDAVADQTLAAGREVFDAGVAGIDAAVEDRDRALHQVEIGRVGESQPVERMLGLHGRIVDREFSPFTLALAIGSMADCCRGRLTGVAMTYWNRLPTLAAWAADWMPSHAKTNDRDTRRDSFSVAIPFAGNCPATPPKSAPLASHIAWPSCVSFAIRLGRQTPFPCGPDPAHEAAAATRSKAPIALRAAACRAAGRGPS